MGKYLGKGSMISGTIEEDMVASRWKSWSIGFDVHLKTVFVAVLIPDYTLGKIQRFVAKYEMDTPSLQSMRNWLLEFKKSYGETEFVIESTSTYHRPIVHLLHGDFTPIIINPALAGSAKKKTDKYDATLLAYHGLTGVWEPSYLPSGLQHDLTMVSRRLMKVVQSITQATNAIGTRLIDANLLLPQQIRMKSASAKAIVQAIVEGVTDPVEAVKRATYYANHLDIPERYARYQRLIDALTALPHLSTSTRHILGALLKDATYHTRQCMLYRDWMYALLRKLTLTYPDSRRVTGEQIITLLTTLPGVSNRYGEVFVAEAGVEVVKRFGSDGALEAFAGFDPSKTYSADKVLSTKSRKGNKYLHTTTIQVAQGLLQHGKRDNPLSKWGRLYKTRLGNTTDAHKQAVAAIGKRIIHISYHILRTGKPYDGSRYHWNAHQSKMVKQLRRVTAHIHDLAGEIQASEVDETTRAIVTEAIHAFSSIAGIEGGFTLSANAVDDPVSKLGLSTRTWRVLQKAGILTLSMLWFRLIQGTLLDVEKFGKKSYEEVVSELVKSGRILKRL